MDREEKALTIALARLVLEHGAPLAIEMIGTLEKATVTLEEIEALRSRVPHPDEYFSEEGEVAP